MNIWIVSVKHRYFKYYNEQRGGGTSVYAIRLFMLDRKPSIER